MNMNKKGFSNILIVIVIVVILLGVAGYFVFIKKVPLAILQTNTLSTTQSSTSTLRDQTANWNTYRSEEYGFEMKYPNMLQTEEYHYSLEKVTVFPPVRFKDEKGNLVEGTIRLGTLWDPRRDPAVDDEGNRIDFENRTRNIILSLATEGLMGSPNPTLVESKKIVDNDTALGYLSVIDHYQKVHRADFQSRSFTAKGPNGGFYPVIISFEMRESDRDRITTDVFNKMISTFRFIR